MDIRTLLMAMVLPLISVDSLKNCGSGFNGWFREPNNGRNCYTVTDQKYHFSGAEEYCRSIGGSLVSIHDSPENGIVEDLVYPGEYFWIGLTKLASQNLDTFDWTDTWNFKDSDHPNGYDNWYPREPNNYGNKEFCTYMNDNGQWNDDQCKYERYGVCKKRFY